MKKRILFILFVLSIMTSQLYGQTIILPSVSIGSKSEPFVYTQTLKVTTSESSITHSFVTTTPMDVIVSHCGSSVLSSSVILYNLNNGIYIISNDALSDCSNPELASLKIANLPAGEYYIASSFQNNNKIGIISLRLEGFEVGTIEVPNSMGNNMLNAIDIGNKSSDFTYSDTRDTNGFTDIFGLPTNDVFYKFTLDASMDITISHCGSGLRDTYLHLLSESGEPLPRQMDEGECENTGQDYIKIANLSAGTYYIVSEGRFANGSITTRIEGKTRLEIDLPYNAHMKHNYILITTPTVSTSKIDTTMIDKAIKTIQYFDELGRLKETIQIGASPNGKSLITYQEYDNYGRESKLWLPIVAEGKGRAFMSYSDFVNKSLDTYNNDTKTFSKIVYEESPLNRVVEQYGPGQDWHNSIQKKAVRTAYLLNNDTYPCCLYTSSDNTHVVSITRSGSTSNYANGQLYVTKLTDEDGNISYEFKDKQGQVILTRQMEGTVSHDTYYVYDNFGNLRAVLPPMATDALSTGTWDESDIHLQQYAYLYKYDSRNRCIAKKLPGAEWIYYIYDNADRLIFSQDSVQRSRSEWTFSIYDVPGRVVLTGTCNNVLNHLEQLDNNVTGIWANRTTDYKGYIINGTTLVNAHLLTVNYYDSYDFMGKNDIPDATNSNYTYDNVSGFPFRYAESEKGLQTGSLTALEESGNVKFLVSTMYYDYRGRLIQTHSDNHLTNGVDKNYINYNFTGQPVHTQHVHSAESKPTLTEYGDFTYDHAGRLLKTEHQLKYNDVLSDKVTLAECTYDELGRLQNKYLHGNSADPIRYQYNVRSWIEDITSNNFSEGLFYNTIAGNMTPLYNGNISAMVWRAGAEGLCGYKFVYDGLNRLTEANYGEGILMTNNPGRFTERITEYDKHGNIRGIERYGKTSASLYGLVDKLSFGYSGNRLKYVNDLANVSSTGQSFHFINGENSTGDEYQYNANGNLIKDSNKNITDIQYNLLNLPVRVELSGNRSATYLYDAAGVKRKVAHLGGGIFKSTDYCGNVIYENGQLDKILTDEGYITLSGATPTYHYNLKDHLGNVRVVQHQDGTTIEQINHYYPFGGLFEQTSEDVQRYKYNDKELDRTYGIDLYDYSARYMDGVLGRFTTMDPLAEKYYSISPYTYCANNPVKFVDPTGEEIVFLVRGDKKVSSFKYRDGNFWHSNGDRYNPSEESISVTMYQVLDAYRKIESSDDEVLKDQLRTLQDSKKTHYIEEGLESEVRIYERGKHHNEAVKMVEESKPVGTQTTFNFSKKARQEVEESTGVKSTVFSSVVHEIRHQYDYDQGKMSDSNGKGAKDPAEIRAVKNENRARKIENIPQRTKYGGVKIQF